MASNANICPTCGEPKLQDAPCLECDMPEPEPLCTDCGFHVITTSYGLCDYCRVIKIMNTEQIKQIQTLLALTEAEMGRIRVMMREASEQPEGITGNSSDSPYVEQPDYSHLLPEGYEFCAEGEHEKWVKVELDPSLSSQEETGCIVNHIGSMKPFYRPIRKIQTNPYQVCTNNTYTIEKHGEGWAIYQGRDSMHHGANIGQIHDGKLADILQRVLNIEQTNPYQVDWSQAPEWADVHAFDEDGSGFWFGVKAASDSWFKANQYSPFTLPDGLDWKLSKTFRPR